MSDRQDLFESMHSRKHEGQLNHGEPDEPERNASADSRVGTENSPDAHSDEHAEADGSGSRSYTADHGEPEGSAEDDGSDYSFMKETVRKRPVKYRRVLVKVLGVVALACLFGAVAGFVFLRVTGEHLPVNSESPVSFGVDQDPMTLAAVSGSVKSDAESLSERSGSEEGKELSDSSEGRSSAEAGEEPVSGEDSALKRAGKSTAADERGKDSAAEGSEETGTGESTTEDLTKGSSTGDSGSEESAETETSGGASESSAQEQTSSAEDHTGTAASDGNAEGGQNAGSAGEEESGSDESTSALTEEERGQAALRDYMQLHSMMKSVAEDAERSMVQVTGITDTEDWFSNTETAFHSASGIIVAETDSRILIFTSSDNIEDAERIAVTFPDGTILSADPVKTDPLSGFGVISVDAGDVTDEMKDTYQAAVLGNSYNVANGDSVIAIGSPLGYSNSVVYGEITSTDSSVSIVDGEYTLLTTNCIGSASGSGALINMDGEVIGFLDQSYAQQNSSVLTAVPISLLKQLIEKLSNREALSYVGISGQTVPEELTTDGTVPKGIYITSVDADSPGLSAGLLPGDILQTVDGTEVDNMRQVHIRIMNSSPGNRLEVTVMRSGAEGYVEFHFTVTIGELS